MATTVLGLASVLLGLALRSVSSQLPLHGAVGEGAYGLGVGMAGTAQPPRMLTCAVEQPDGRRLSVTVRDKTGQNGATYGVTAGLPYMAMSPVFTAFSGLGGGWAMAEGGLDMAVETSLLRDIPTAYFTFTEFASSSPQCPTASLGKILTPSADGSHFNGFAGAHNIAGMSPLHGVGSLMFARGSATFGQPSFSAPGIVATASVTAGTLQSVQLTKVQGFRLEELAGRGFVICDSISYNWDWQPQCDTLMADICCGLAFSNGADGAGLSLASGHSSGMQVPPYK